MSGSGGREGTEETPARAAVLGPVLKRFCEEQGIDPIEFDVESSFVKRYLRVAPGPDAERVTNALISRLGANRVRWLPGFLALPLSVPLAAQPEYHAAHVFGMDAASAARVLAPRSGDHVLDLCCAAGAKMAYLAALLGDRGSVTGVDASAMRMDITVQRLKRCGVLRPAAGVRARLYTGPGQDFELPPPEGGERVEELPGFELAADTAEADDPLLLPQRRRRGKRGRRERAAASKRRRAAVEGRLEEARAAWRARPGYDRVLVDAPCTHDASLRHVAKAQEGEGLEAKAFHPDYVAELAHTQAALLCRGFDALRPGGTLVYATCSFTRAQNEGVVQRLLAARPLAKLEPALTPSGHFRDSSHGEGGGGGGEGEAGAKDAGAAAGGPPHPCDGAVVPAVAGGLPGTLRFQPRVSGTSGLFIARVTKQVA